MTTRPTSITGKWVASNGGDDLVLGHHVSHLGLGHAVQLHNYVLALSLYSDIQTSYYKKR